MTAYYNEIDPFAAAWLRELITAGHIAPGDVDTRSIVDVRPSDLRGYAQCHFFAGIAGWSLALRLAGWPDDRPVWTGSCPCQPFSPANTGRRKGFDDARHLWPVWLPLISQCRPPVVFGEQSAKAAAWLRLVRGDLATVGFAMGAIPIEAACVGARQLRDRYWFVAEPHDSEQPSFALDAEVAGAPAPHARPDCTRLEVQFTRDAGQQPPAIRTCWWSAEPGVGIVAYGVSDRMAKIRALGNAIVPPLAAEVIGAYLDAERVRLTGAFA